MSSNNTYLVTTIDEIDSPSLLVFPELIKENIQNCLGINKDDTPINLRPHIKTVKSVEVLKMAMDEGICKFKCSTISEAELLGVSKAKDALLCSQLSETKLQRFIKIITDYPETRFAVLIDNLESYKLLKKQKISIEFFMDINVGLNRTGCKPSFGISLLKSIPEAGYKNFRGFHAYDGHIHVADRSVRKKQAEEVYNTMRTLKLETDVLVKKQVELIMGGSPSFEFYADKAEVQCSPGTFYLWDAGYKKAYPELPFKEAALILTRVISIIDEHTICFDLGYKAVASESPLPQRIQFLDNSHFVLKAQFEEHLVVEVPNSDEYRVGQSFLAIPNHICPTVNLYEELVPIVNGNIQKSWKVVARDRKITH